MHCRLHQHRLRLQHPHTPHAAPSHDMMIDLMDRIARVAAIIIIGAAAAAAAAADTVPQPMWRRCRRLFAVLYC